MDKIEILIGKSDIDFWLKALSNSNLEKESIVLLNKGLQNEIYKYLNPIITFKDNYDAVAPSPDIMLFKK